MSLHNAHYVKAEGWEVSGIMDAVFACIMPETTSDNELIIGCATLERLISAL